MAASRRGLSCCHVALPEQVKLSSDSNHILRCATNVLLTACLRRCHICQRTNDESDATTVKVGEQEVEA